MEVGAKLYEIDTEASATVTASNTVETLASVPVVEKLSEVVVAPDHQRAPSIKFLGKNGWEALRKGYGKSLPKDASGGFNSNPLAVKLIVDDSIAKNPMYGRPKFTEAEIEALLTGGATMAPQLLSPSTGARFKM